MTCKKLFLLLVLLSTLYCTSRSQEFVKIEYLGAIYKPIETLIISKAKIVDTTIFTKNIILNEENYSRFKDTILTHLQKNYQRGKNDFGCFMITIGTKEKSRHYFLPKKEISVRYFRRILIAVKDAKFGDELSDFIRMYLTRIGN
jgi:hypothetical protein